MVEVAKALQRYDLCNLGMGRETHENSGGRLSGICAPRGGVGELRVEEAAVEICAVDDVFADGFEVDDCEGAAFVRLIFSTRRRGLRREAASIVMPRALAEDLPAALRKQTPPPAPRSSH
jgi:hypothetical protein